MLYCVCKRIDVEKTNVYINKLISIDSKIKKNDNWGSSKMEALRLQHNAPYLTSSVYINHWVLPDRFSIGWTYHLECRSQGFTYFSIVALVGLGLSIQANKRNLGSWHSLSKCVSGNVKNEKYILLTFYDLEMLK